MQRIMIVGFLSISVAVLLAVGSVVWQLSSYAPPPVGLATADPAVGYAFYSELDRLLAGDAAANLDPVVTDDFVDHFGDANAIRGVDELTQQLTSFGAMFPGAAFEVESIEASGDSLIVLLSPNSTQGSTVAGLNLQPLTLSSGVEVLHLRRGRVSERWPAPLPAVSAATFAAASTTSYSVGAIYGRLFRVELPPSGELDWISSTLSAVIVETGVLSLTVGSTTEDGATEVQKTTVPAGTAQLLPHKSHIQLRTNVPEITQLLVLDAQPVDSMLFMPFTRLGGVTSKLLWHTQAPLPMTEPWKFAIGRIEIPAGFALKLENPDGLEIVLEVERAPAELSIVGGVLSQLEANYSMSAAGSMSVLAAGTAAQLTRAGRVRVRPTTDEPSAVWVISLGPVDAEAIRATPSAAPRRREQREALSHGRSTLVTSCHIRRAEASSHATRILSANDRAGGVSEHSDARQPSEYWEGTAGRGATQAPGRELCSCSV